MKKHTLRFIITIVIIFCMISPVFAEENTVSNDKNTILEQIKINSAVKATDPVFNTELYGESLKGYNFQDDILLKIYTVYNWEDAGEDVDVIIDNYTSKYTDVLYAVFRNDSFYCRIDEFHKNGNVSFHLTDMYPDEICTVWDDIENSAFMNSPLFDANSSFTKVFCFDAYWNYDGFVVYYVQENSTAVWFYEYPDSPHVEFALDEFKTLAKAFVESWTDTDEDRPVPRFLDFVKHHNQNEIKEPTNDIKEIEKDIDNSDGESTRFVWYIIPIAVALVVSIATIVLVWRKKMYEL